jgi:putative addiction module killer protein
MYVTTAGKKVFQDWLDSLDESTSARVAARLDRIEQGNFGDCKPAREGVYELRLDFGPGYRVYFGIVSGQVVLLTCGGTKKTQTKDIESAIEYLKEYKKRHI